MNQFLYSVCEIDRVSTPTDPFTTLELQNQYHDSSQLHNFFNLLILKLQNPERAGRGQRSRIIRKCVP